MPESDTPSSETPVSSATPSASTDRGMPLYTVTSATFDAVKTFYTDTLGFDLATWKPSDDGGFAIFRYGASQVGFATHGGLEDLGAPTTNAVTVLYMPEVEGVHRVLSARGGDAVGALRDVGWGRFFDVRDPSGNGVRYVELTGDDADG